jgi:hypothetical protein
MIDFSCTDFPQYVLYCLLLPQGNGSLRGDF